jgi:uncharacterized protein YkwD
VQRRGTRRRPQLPRLTNLLLAALLALLALGTSVSAANAHQRARAHAATSARHGGGCVPGAVLARSNRWQHWRLLRHLCRGTAHRGSGHVRLLSRGNGSEPRASTNPPAKAHRAAATIATILATPCTDTEVAPEAQNLALVQAAVLCLINRERATHSEQPLRINPRLQHAAESHSRECVELNYFAHVSPSGETPVQRIQATGYVPSPLDGYVLGENLAWGTYELGTAESIVAAWIASPPHLANILEARYTETGIGVTPAVPSSRGEGAPGATYAQEFGVILQ